jgi:hypothetical protein
MALGRHHTPMPAEGGIHPISSSRSQLNRRAQVRHLIGHQ